MSAILYAAADGRLLRVAQPGRDPEPPEAPAGTAHTLSVDAETNRALVRDVIDAWDAYRLSVEGLAKDGQPVVIAPDGPERTIRARLAAALDANRQIITAMQEYAAVADTATAAQVRTQVKRLSLAVESHARQLVGLERLLLQQLDGTD